MMASFDYYLPGRFIRCLFWCQIPASTFQFFPVCVHDLYLNYDGLHKDEACDGLIPVTYLYNP